MKTLVLNEREDEVSLRLALIERERILRDAIHNLLTEESKTGNEWESSDAISLRNDMDRCKELRHQLDGPKIDFNGK